MTPAAFLSHLHEQGVALAPDGPDLRVTALGSVLTPELRATIRAAKPDLLLLLSEPPAPASEPIQEPPPEPALLVIPEPEPFAGARVWTAAEAALIDWFLRWEPPAEPFTLHPGWTVTDPLLFAMSLRQDVAAGPEGARARTGALQDDLHALYGLFGEGAGP